MRSLSGKRAVPPERVPLLYGGAEPRFSAIYENFLRRGCCLDVSQQTAIARALLAEQKPDGGKPRD